MTRSRAIEIMVRVWGMGNTITGQEAEEVDAAGLQSGEDILNALHRIAGIPRPDPVEFPSFQAKTSEWYRNLR